MKERKRDLKQHLHQGLIDNPRVSINNYHPGTKVRGLKEHEAPFPVVARVGPYTLNELPHMRNFYWCSCGMSRSQPFCDKSHFDTRFKPLKFMMEEKADEVHLCGCKLTTLAPFCDGQTCQTIRDGQPLIPRLDEDLQSNNPEVEEN